MDESSSSNNAKHTRSMVEVSLKTTRNLGVTSQLLNMFRKKSNREKNTDVVDIY